jgi:hypothetical protein
MADNVRLNAGSGGDIVAADDISGVKYTRCKITLGTDGVNSGDVSESNPIPAAQLPGSAIAGYNQIAVGTTRVQIGIAAAKRGILIRSRSGNTAKIYLGSSTVTISNGFELNPSDSVVLPLNNANLVYAISDSTNQILCWMAI